MKRYNETVFQTSVLFSIPFIQSLIDTQLFQCFSDAHSIVTIPPWKMVRWIFKKLSFLTKPIAMSMILFNRDDNHFSFGNKMSTAKSLKSLSTLWCNEIKILNNKNFKIKVFLYPTYIKCSLRMDDEVRIACATTTEILRHKLVPLFNGS